MTGQQLLYLILCLHMVNNFRFKISFINGGGNDLYIDDINISGPVSLQETETVFDFFVFPNPAKRTANIQFNLANNKDRVDIGLYNVVGKQVKEVYQGALNSGSQNFLVAVNDLSSGIYFISIISDDRKVTQRLVVE